MNADFKSTGKELLLETYLSQQRFVDQATVKWWTIGNKMNSSE